MKSLKGNNIGYVKLFIVIVLSYIAIKLIDNVPTEVGWAADLYHLLTPFIIALVITYILNPIVNFLTLKGRIPRKLSIVITYLTFVLLVVLAALYLLPKLYDSAVSFFNAFPVIKDKSEHLLKAFHLNSFLDPNSLNFKALIKQALSGAISLTGSIVDFALGFLISIYVTADKDKFLNASKKLTLIALGKKNGEKVIEFIKILSANIGTYLGVCIIDSLIVATVAFIGMSLIGTNYAILLAFIMFAMNLIPFIGPYIAIVIIFIVCLITGTPTTAIITAVFLEVLHEFDSWFIQPKLIGNKTGLNPAVILLAITIGGAIYGPIGMILSTPIATVLTIYGKKILSQYKYRGEFDKK
ncbi:MAG: AI-2E family transporter [Sarcina sp.]